MEVMLKINTEKEDLNELKRLQTWICELISKREQNMATRIEQQKKEEELKSQQAAQIASQPKHYQAPAPPKKEYSGSGRIIDYEDMSDMMSKVFSGGRI